MVRAPDNVRSMATLSYRFEIPDLARPIPEAERGAAGPSAHLIPFDPEPLDPSQVIGRRVDDVTTSAGTYGMGGPGFFALLLGNEWLVIALWGAASWMTCEGRLIEDLFHDTANRPQPWLANGIDEFQTHIVDRTVKGIDIAPESLRIDLSGGADLTLSPDPATRPAFAGNGQPRALGREDDLRAAVFLSPTTDLWV
jgi:hypothetical protein